MIRVTALYREQPDADRYEQHAELCRRVPGSTFRHGRVLRTIHGEPEIHYYAEFESRHGLIQGGRRLGRAAGDRHGCRRDGRAALRVPGQR